ncbi:hypothetical protein Vadar_009052 [Vaccinium darrowii]|uniref:Uncharacterized protein n=1 Tax=Vaccinium darrowii TaxID=229202 RepID=A0ACB7ZKH3_9ERIC|nr:hypothetical protein Vadar_009052 [Vaccinium darrowii]
MAWNVHSSGVFTVGVMCRAWEKRFGPWTASVDLIEECCTTKGSVLFLASILSPTLQQLISSAYRSSRTWASGAAAAIQLQYFCTRQPPNGGLWRRMNKPGKWTLLTRRLCCSSSRTEGTKHDRHWMTNKPHPSFCSKKQIPYQKAPLGLESRILKSQPFI